jgi:hypothetical protein
VHKKCPIPKKLTKSRAASRKNEAIKVSFDGGGKNERNHKKHPDAAVAPTNQVTVEQERTHPLGLSFAMSHPEFFSL